MCVCVCVCACVRACVCACVRVYTIHIMLWVTPCNHLISYLFTVRADIDDVIGIRPDPYSPIEDGSPGELCLLAGSTVTIVCPNIAFPVADVFFFKNNNPVELNSRFVCVCVWGGGGGGGVICHELLHHTLSAQGEPVM